MSTRADRRGPLAFATGVGLCLGLAGCARSESRWAADLESRDPFERALAALALSELAPQRGPQVTPVLLATVDHVELRLQPQLERALTRVAPYACEALVAALIEDEFMTLERREAALDALAATGPQAVETAVAAVRGSGLARTGPLVAVLARAGAPAVARLVSFATGDSDPQVRAFAARGLAAIGAPALPAVVQLRAGAALAAPELRAELEAACAQIEAKASGDAR